MAALGRRPRRPRPRAALRFAHSKLARRNPLPRHESGDRQRRRGGARHRYRAAVGHVQVRHLVRPPVRVRDPMRRVGTRARGPYPARRRRRQSRRPALSIRRRRNRYRRRCLARQIELPMNSSQALDRQRNARGRQAKATHVSVSYSHVGHGRRARVEPAATADVVLPRFLQETAASRIGAPFPRLRRYPPPRSPALKGTPWQSK